MLKNILIFLSLGFYFIFILVIVNNKSSCVYEWSINHLYRFYTIQMHFLQLFSFESIFFILPVNIFLHAHLFIHNSFYS